MRNGGAAHKMMEAPRILIALRTVVIESATKGSFLHCGQYRMGIGRETTTWRYVFPLSHMHCLSVCKEDFSLRSK